MGTVLEFKTRAERLAEELQASTDRHLTYMIYVNHTKSVLRDLLEFYQKGNWDHGCDILMERAAGALLQVCALVSSKEREKIDEPPTVG